jgi:hypothetical protein
LRARDVMSLVVTNYQHANRYGAKVVSHNC